MNKTRQAADRAWQSTRKNLIINGNFRIWQRGDKTSLNNTELSADRWKYLKVSSSVVDISEGAMTNIGGILTPYLELDVTTADASVATNDYSDVGTRLEGQDIAHLAWGTSDAKDVTLSFWHNHTKVGTHNVGLRSNSNHAYIAEYTQSVSNTWEKSTITIPGPTGGTWASDNLLGLTVYFLLYSGSQYVGTGNTWATDANLWATSGHVNNVDSVSNFFRIAQVQLEEGSEASDFEHRTFNQELIMCQRYFSKSYGYSVAPGYSGSGSGKGSTQSIATASGYAMIDTQFPVVMRTAPTVTAFSYVNGNTGVIVINGVNKTATVGSIETGGCSFYNTVAGTGSAYSYAHWTANAEL